MDVTDAASLYSAATLIVDRHGQLDVLVNNAGIKIEEDRTPSLDDYERTFPVNVFGASATIEAMVPALQASGAGRVVNVSSALGSLTIWSNDEFVFTYKLKPTLAYCSSKAALNAVTVLWARRLAETEIKVNAADPGLTATATTNYVGTTPKEASKVIERLATLPQDGATGGFFSNEGPLPW
jgi:NAD(P)-dependent dehydrogenase (short-subunit alcohol dehydrogenase family)